MNVHGFILPSRILGVFFLFAGLVFAGVAVWLYSSAAADIRAATRTTGTIVELKQSDGQNGTTYSPVFRFRDSAGEDRTITSTWGSNPPSYAVGDAVTILYPPTRPNGAWIDGFWSNWLLPFVFASAVVPQMLIAAFFIWFIPFVIRRVWPMLVVVPTEPSSAASTLPAAIAP